MSEEIKGIKERILARGYIGYEEILLSSLETRDNEIKALEGLRMSLRDEITELKSSLEKEKELNNQITLKWNEENAKVARYLNLPGDGRLFSDQTIEAFKKEKERAEKAERQAKMWEEIKVAEKKILIQEIEDHTKTKERVKELMASFGSSLAFERIRELEVKLQKLVEAVKKLKSIDEQGSYDPSYFIDAKRELYKVLEEMKSDLKDYTSPNLLIEQLSERIKELEVILASIKADPSIGKLIVECDCDHDGEFDAGQRHCRKCGGYLF